MEVIDIHTHMMGATWVDAITSHKNYGSAEFNGKKMIALAGKPYIPIDCLLYTSPSPRDRG